MRHETCNEYIIRKYRSHKTRGGAYKNPILVWIGFSIPIFNILMWLGFFFAYYENREKIK